MDRFPAQHPVQVLFATLSRHQTSSLVPSNVTHLLFYFFILFFFYSPGMADVYRFRVRCVAPLSLTPPKGRP